MRTLLLFLNAAIISAAGMTVAGCDWSDSNFLQACESALKERLRSPSTYVRVSTNEYARDLDFSDYVIDNEVDIDDATSYRERGLINTTKRHGLLIEYDAQNGFGAPIRDVADCQYDTISEGTIASAKEYSVRINGRSHTQWLAYKARQPSRPR